MIIMSDRYVVKILNRWGTSETYVDFLIYDQEELKIAHCCNWYDGDLELTNDEIIEDILKDASEWFKLPKTSTLSDITYFIYQSLCQSENDMLYIDENAMENFSINSETLKELETDIKKYNLQDYFEYQDRMIIVYGGLQTAFNDDRNLNIESNKDYFINNDLEL